jgi:predicted transcriptional regulator
MEGHPWQRRAKEAGLSQKRLAELLGVSEKAVSKGLRGLWQGGVPRYMKLVILCWRALTPEQRRRVLADLESADRPDPDGRA